MDAHFFTMFSDIPTDRSFDRIHAPEGDPRKITMEIAIDAAYLNEDLSFADLQHLRKEVAELRTESGAKFSERKKGLFDAIKPSIDKSNPLMGKMDPSGAQWFYKYTSYVEKQVSAYRQEGKDPWELLDPTKSTYLGRPEVVQQFQPTIQDSMKAMSENLQRGNTPAAPPAPAKPRLPGETIQQWLNRKGNVEAAPVPRMLEPSKPETSALEPAPAEGIPVADFAFTKGVVESMKGSHRIEIASWAKFYREGRMKDDELRRQLGRVFESYLNGRPKDLNRAVNVEMHAIKQLRPID